MKHEIICKAYTHVILHLGIVLDSSMYCFLTFETDPQTMSC